jgi:hypothetical protein
VAAISHNSRRLPRVTALTARRLLMHRQGLLDDPAQKATSARLQALIERMGFVQVDTINVLERAHHLTLGSRMDGYRPAMLAHLLESRRSLFEHWTHDASIIPVRWRAHWRPRFERYRQRDPAHAWWKARMGPEPQRVFDDVLRRIESEGPLMSRDFERRAVDRTGVKDAWWQWKPHKAALEYLWRSGDLAIARRVNFQKVYDLAHRVLGPAPAAPREDEHADWACRSAMERLAIATPREIAAFWHAIDLPAARAWCEAALNRGEIVPVEVETADGSGPRQALAIADWPRAVTRAPDPPPRLRLLSPFDPVLRDRARARRLFNFDYTLEVFVPEAKRRYGYYAMPVLEGDQLIGRADLKFHRDRGVLEALGAWWERGVRLTPERRRAWMDALERLAAAIGAKDVKASQARAARSAPRRRRASS